MKNSVEISVVFSFKGETFTPKVTVDLDQFIRKDGSIPDLHNLLALHDGIDTYSYAFEVMQQAEIKYNYATGLASDCLQDGQFDFQHYIQKRNDDKLHVQLGLIVKNIMGIEDLSNTPELRDALIQAYKLGQQATATYR